MADRGPATPRHVSLNLASVGDEPIPTCTLRCNVRDQDTSRCGHNQRLSRTLCAPLLHVAEHAFNHTRLHRLSKGRPDSLVNPILGHKPRSAWCDGGRGVSVKPHPPLSAFLLLASGCLAAWLLEPSDLPTDLPARPAREVAESFPVGLEPAFAIKQWRLIGLAFSPISILKWSTHDELCNPLHSQPSHVNGWFGSPPWHESSRSII